MEYQAGTLTLSSLRRERLLRTVCGGGILWLKLKSHRQKCAINLDKDFRLFEMAHVSRRDFGREMDGKRW